MRVLMTPWPESRSTYNDIADITYFTKHYTLSFYCFRCHYYSMLGSNSQRKKEFVLRSHVLTLLCNSHSWNIILLTAPTLFSIPNRAQLTHSSNCPLYNFSTCTKKKLYFSLLLSAYSLSREYFNIADPKNRPLLIVLSSRRYIEKGNTYCYYYYSYEVK
jgi:hypothetical protein